MKRVAVTGGIASGKSTAIKYIKDLGYPVFSCDEIYKTVIQQEGYIQAVKERFPGCVIGGKIDRGILSQIVFEDKKQRHLLNRIAHPLIIEELYKQMENCGAPVVFAEVPLLFEGGYENDFDNVIVIKRNRLRRVEDLVRRDQISNADAEKRISSQFDYDAQEADARIKKCRAIVVKNDGDLQSLQRGLDDALLIILGSL